MIGILTTPSSRLVRHMECRILQTSKGSFSLEAFEDPNFSASFWLQLDVANDQTARWFQEMRQSQANGDRKVWA